jgi:hypothetical protein
MGDEPMNAPNMDATQRGEINEQHQNVAKPVVQKNLVVFSTIHQETPRTITQPKVVNVHNGDNHEPFQPFDEVIYVQQLWRFVSPGYNLPKTGASTSITASAGFLNQPSQTNIHLVSTNLEMERLHLFNGLE